MKLFFTFVVVIGLAHTSHQCSDEVVIEITNIRKVTAQQCDDGLTLAEVAKSLRCDLMFSHLVTHVEKLDPSVGEALKPTNKLANHYESQVCDPKMEDPAVVGAVFAQPQGAESTKLRCWIGPVVFGTYSQSTNIEHKGEWTKMLSNWTGNRLKTEQSGGGADSSGISEKKAETVCAGVISHRVHMDRLFSLWDSYCEEIVIDTRRDSNSEEIAVTHTRKEERTRFCQGWIRFQLDHSVKVSIAIDKITLNSFHPMLNTYLGELNVLVQRPSESVYDGIVVRSSDIENGKAFLCYAETKGVFASFELPNNFESVNDSSVHYRICTGLFRETSRLPTVLAQAARIPAQKNPEYLTGNFEACTSRSLVDNNEKVTFKECFGAPNNIFVHSISVSQGNCKQTLRGPFTHQSDLRAAMAKAMADSNLAKNSLIKSLMGKTRKELDVCNPSSGDAELIAAVQPVAVSGDKSLVCKIKDMEFGLYQQGEDIAHIGFGSKLTGKNSSSKLQGSQIPVTKARKICAGVLERRERIEHRLNIYDSPCSWNEKDMQTQSSAFYNAFKSKKVCPDQKSVRFQVQSGTWVTLNGIVDPHRLFAAPLLKLVNDQVKPIFSFGTTLDSSSDSVWTRTGRDGWYFCYKVKDQPFLFAAFKDNTTSADQAASVCARLLSVQEELARQPRWISVDTCAPMAIPYEKDNVGSAGVHYSDCSSGDMDIVRLSDGGILECSVHISGVTFGAVGKDRSSWQGLLLADLCNPKDSDKAASVVQVRVSYHPDRQVVYCNHDPETEGVSWVTYWVKTSDWKERGKNICERIAQLKNSLKKRIA